MGGANCILRTILHLLILSVAAHSSYIHLYKEQDHGIMVEEIDVGDPGDCVNLKDGRQATKSVDTIGGCVELYDRKNCRGQKIRVASRQFAYNNMKEWNFENRAVSAGTCSTLVQLYDGVNRTGSRQKLKLWGKKDCVSLNEGQTTKNLGSVVTSGCVMLYAEEDCHGTGIKIIDSKPVHGPVQDKMAVKTVGTCSPSDQYGQGTKDGPNHPPTSVGGVGKFGTDGPIFGEYVESKNASIIKFDDATPSVQFCELARRCTKNRQLDCGALPKNSRCYCHPWDHSVFCESLSSPGRRLHGPWEQKGGFVPDETFRFPIAGEFQKDYGGYLYITSSSYEFPYSDSCELSKRCQEKTSRDGQQWGCRPEEQGGKGYQLWCQVDQQTIGAVLPAGSAVPTRTPEPVDEDEESSGLHG